MPILQVYTNRKLPYEGPFSRSVSQSFNLLISSRHNNKLIRRILINFMLEKSILHLSWFQFQQQFRGNFMATKRSVPFPAVWLIGYWVESESLKSAESNIESNLRIWKTSNRISNRILSVQNIESNLKMIKKHRIES